MTRSLIVLAEGRVIFFSSLGRFGDELDRLLGRLRPELEHFDDVKAILTFDEDLQGFQVARHARDLCSSTQLDEETRKEHLPGLEPRMRSIAPEHPLQVIPTRSSYTIVAVSTI